jgi:hypothetical protein
MDGQTLGSHLGWVSQCHAAFSR